MHMLHAHVHVQRVVMDGWKVRVEGGGGRLLTLDAAHGRKGWLVDQVERETHFIGRRSGALVGREAEGHARLGRDGDDACE